MPDRRDELDEYLDEFDRHWQEGFAPRVQDFLASCEQYHPSIAEKRYLILEALRIDIEYRWSRPDAAMASTMDIGEDSPGLPGHPKIEDYQRVLGLDDLTTEELIDLVKDEFRARCQSGHNVELAEYRERFPDLPPRFESQLKRIAKQIQVEQAQTSTDQLFGFTTTRSSAFSSGAIPSAGVEFGGYLVLDRIGSGAMGLVFHARHTRLGRDVALKVIRSGAFATRAEIRRLYREAEAAAKLDHKGIVPIYEVGREGPLHFFSMAYVDGSDLDREVRDSPMSPVKAARLVASVSEAVDYAHGQGVVHRDLKPGNILVDRDGQPRVTDFGLAREFSADERLTIQGEVLGTPGYMPPEQAAGESRNVNAAGDIYSLGAVLYRIVTGRPPFQAATQLETIQQVLEDAPVAPRLLNRSIPRDLENIILKCLEKDPPRRYRTAGELAEDLNRFLRGDPTLARPLGPVRRALRTVRKNPRPVVLMLAIGLFAGMIGYREWKDSLTEFVNRRALTLNRQQFESLRQQLAAQQRGYQQQLQKKEFERYVLLTDNVRTLIGLGQRAAAIDMLEGQIRADATLNVHAGWELDYLQNLAASDELCDAETRPANFTRELRDFRTVQALAIDPVSEFLAAGSQESAVVLLHGQSPSNFSQSEFTVVPTWIRLVRSLDFSSDGAIFAACGEVAENRANVLLRHVSSLDNDERDFSWSGHNPIAVGFLRGSQTLLAADDRGHFMTLDPATGQSKTLAELNTDVLGVDFSADGKTAVVATSSGHTLLTTLQRGEIPCEFAVPAVRCTINLRGDKAAIINNDSTLTVLEGPWTDNATKTHTFGQARLQAVCFSPDGRFLATGSEDGIVRIRDARRYNLLQSFSINNEPIQTLTFAPDGRYIIAGSGTGRLNRWGIACPTANIGYPLEQKSVSAFAVCEADRTVVSAGDEGALKLFEIDCPHDSRMIGCHPFPRGTTPHSVENKVIDLDIDNDTGIVASVCARGTVYLCDSRSDSPLSFSEHLVDSLVNVSCVCFRPGSPQLACGTTDGTIVLYSVATDIRTLTLSGHGRRVTAIEFTNDGAQAVSCDEGGTLIGWNLDDGSVNWIAEDQGIRAIEIDDQNQLMAIGSGGIVTFRDIATEEVIDTIQLQTGEHCISIARLGPNRFATVTDASHIQIRDRISGQLTLDLSVDDSLLSDIAVISGEIIAASDSGMLYRWQGKSSRQNTSVTIPVIE